MTRPRLLDMFCGEGGMSMGYHRAGFDVVGVDCNDDWADVRQRPRPKPLKRYPTCSGTGSSRRTGRNLGAQSLCRHGQTGGSSAPPTTAVGHRGG